LIPAYGVQEDESAPRFAHTISNEREFQMNWYRKPARTVIFTLALGALFFLPRAHAQTQPGASIASPEPKETNADDGLHVDITPYIWFAGMHGTTGVLDHDASVHATFGDIFNYLNIGAMGDMEVRYNRVIMPLDFIWMKLSDNRALPVNDVAQSIKAKMTETVLTPKIGYRVADGKRVKVDALFGIRYWHLSSDLTLQPVQVAGGFSQSANWVDAVAGGRVIAALTPKAFVTIGGDAGGGTARSDYQVGGFLGYRVSRKCIVDIGYRYMSIDYRSTAKALFVYDLNMPGLILGATINLK
jgi:hypothetical protein